MENEMIIGGVHDNQDNYIKPEVDAVEVESEIVTPSVGMEIENRLGDTKDVLDCSMDVVVVTDDPSVVLDISHPLEVGEPVVLDAANTQGTIHSKEDLVETVVQTTNRGIGPSDGEKAFDTDDFRMGVNLRALTSNQADMDNMEFRRGLMGVYGIGGR